MYDLKSYRSIARNEVVRMLLNAVKMAGSDGPIINELLCFVFNKWSQIDVDTLIKLCIDTYDEKEIEASKDILFGLLRDESDSTLFKRRRAGKSNETKSVNNLRDICQLLEEKGDAKLPDFVALDLGNLPPITFNHLDVSVLLSKIEKLSCNVNFLKEGMGKVTNSCQSMCDFNKILDS